MNKYDLYLKMAVSQLDEQERRNRDIDVKMSGLTTLSAALVAVEALVFKEAPFEKLDYLTYAALISVAVHAGAFLGVILCGFFVVKSRKWYYDPKLEYLDENLDKYSGDGLTLWVGGLLAESVDWNEDNLVQKFSHLKRSIWILAVQVLALLATSTLVVLLNFGAKS